MANVTKQLRCLDSRGETINTRWGPVSFDADGLAELELPEDEVQMLREIKPHSWLAEDHASFRRSEKPRGEKTKGDAKK